MPLLAQTDMILAATDDSTARLIFQVTPLIYGTWQPLSCIFAVHNLLLFGVKGMTATYLTHNKIHVMHSENKAVS